MTLRRATDADLETLCSLWDEWVDDGDAPIPPWVEGAREGTVAGIERALSDGGAVVWEEGDEAVAFACGVMQGARSGELTELYVRPSARRRGIGRALARAVVDELGRRGAEYVTVGVTLGNVAARAFYERAGFQPEELRLVAGVATLVERLAKRPTGECFGSIHIQTDDLPAVERAVRQFVPRLPGASRGTVLSPPRNGWIAVYDELCDRERAMLRRLARELSDRMGAVVVALGVEDGATVRYLVFERGRVVDEYLSVPEFHGPLPPGDVVAMAANPTAVARLTGADPARVRAVARTARTPAELPPAPELLAEIGEALGLEGADHGHREASAIPGAIEIPRP